MKSEKKIWFAVFGLFFLISGCQDDKGDGTYSKVSELIVDRNRSRLAKKTGNYPRQTGSPEERAAELSRLEDTKVRDKLREREEELTYIILYEEDVDIIASESGKTLARGVAYINKQGQIVRIKISKK